MSVCVVLVWSLFARDKLFAGLCRRVKCYEAGERVVK